MTSVLSIPQMPSPTIPFGVIPHLPVLLAPRIVKKEDAVMPRFNQPLPCMPTCFFKIARKDYMQFREDFETFARDIEHTDVRVIETGNRAHFSLTVTRKVVEEDDSQDWWRVVCWFSRLADGSIAFIVRRTDARGFSIAGEFLAKLLNRDNRFTRVPYENVLKDWATIC